MADEIKDELKAKIDDETTPTDESLNTDESKENVDKTIPYDRFKQKVDEANALKAKLDEIEQAKAEEERKQLEAQNEYKTLYEQALEQAEQAKAEALTTKKNALLTQAGYGDDQIALLSKLVDGETDDEIAQSIKLLATTFPAQDSYGDPSAFNGEKGKPETVGPEVQAKKIYERIKNKII